MTEKELKKIEHPKMRYDPTLDDRYKEMSLFPEKLAKCEETIRRIGLPEEYYKKNNIPRPPSSSEPPSY